MPNGDRGSYIIELMQSKPRGWLDTDGMKKIVLLHQGFWQDSLVQAIKAACMEGTLHSRESPKWMMAKFHFNRASMNAFSHTCASLTFPGQNLCAQGMTTTVVHCKNLLLTLFIQLISVFVAESQMERRRKNTDGYAHESPPLVLSHSISRTFLWLRAPSSHHYYEVKIN